MNITIDMVTGETENNAVDNIVVISNRYSSEQPEIRESNAFHAPDLAIQQIEITGEAPPAIPKEIVNVDIDTFLNDMC